MSKFLVINDETFKKFQAALILMGDDEEIVLRELLNEYIHKAFESVMKKNIPDEQHANTKVDDAKVISASEQKQLFTNWFRSLTRNGKAYNPVTISGYAGRIENACNDPVFSAIPVKNLFTINNLAEFISLQKQIKGCSGYAEFDAKSHNGFTAALRKYEEFLKLQESGDSVVSLSPKVRSYKPSSNIHRWTMEEDEICCKRFLEYYVIDKSNIDIVQFLKIIAKEVPDVSEGSLRMKIQNIKYLTVQAGLKDTASIKWLSQYSMQCEKAFNKALQELKLLA